MDEDPIKQAFQKAKEDIYNLYYNYQYLNSQIADLKHLIESQNNEIKGLKDLIKRTLDRQTDRQTNLDTPSFPVDTSTDTSTDNLPLEALKHQNAPISIGNKGVSTDRQTDKQTDNTLERAPEVIETLNKIKEEVRIKFQELTPQEMKVFTTIYQLEDQGLTIDYGLLAQYIQITESSIRDHISRIIKKGIPIDKTKEKNKKVILKISNNLKGLASLETILKLRDS